jgi:hypothetical protein
VSRRARAWEWIVETGSWALVPLMLVGLAALVLIETRAQRRRSR